MALQTATTAKNASDTAAIQERIALDSLTMTIINTEITRESTKTDLDEKTFKATLSFDALILDETKIIQSDNSKIFLTDIEKALISKGYRVSCRAIKSHRVNVNDKVKLQVAWS